MIEVAQKLCQILLVNTSAYRVNLLYDLYTARICNFLIKIGFIFKFIDITHLLINARKLLIIFIDLNITIPRVWKAFKFIVESMFFCFVFLIDNTAGNNCFIKQVTFLSLSISDCKEED